MELIVLGSSASYALPDEATSGYLIKSEDNSLAIDLGNGCLSNLFRWQDPANLNALILSHIHMDHVSDIYPLRLYLKFEHPDKKLQIIAPAGSAKKLGSILSPKGFTIFQDTFRFEEISEKNIQINDFKISFKKMDHDVETFAIKIESSGKKLVYSADTAYNKNLVNFAKDADLLLAEATLIEEIPGVQHMSLKQAAIVASEAKVKKLVITHIWPSHKDSNCIKTASKYFKGKIEMASANKRYKL